MTAVLFESLGTSVIVFVAAAGAITICGVRLTRLADQLADRTGWGEAILGGVFLAGVTSLPDFAATLTAAAGGFAQLAMSNVLGSISVNLAFLAVGDLVYRKANLEHAAASQSNLTQATLSVVLLVLPLIAMTVPAVYWWGVHPVTPVLVAGYLFGYRMVRDAHSVPMWTPKRTADTVEDLPEAAAGQGRRMSVLWLEFAGFAVLIAIAGWALMSAAETIATETRLTESAVGALLTGVFTSMPELVTTIAAIRYGALTLAVGNILGTNCFNMLVIAAADAVYSGGSIYHAVAWQEQLWALVAILMTAVLLLGFLYRERVGFARIGFESSLVLVIYAATAAVIIGIGSS